MHIRGSAGIVGRLLAAAIALAAGACCGATAPAQPGLDLDDLSAPVFTSFGARDGVPDAVSVDVRTDRDGFTWLASAHGLARYDGHAWDASGAAAAVGTLGDFMLDHAGTLWVAFRDRGLGWWDGSGWHMRSRANGLPTNHIRRLIETVDAKGAYTLWAATFGDGLLQRDAQGDWRPVPDNATLPRYISTIAQTSRLGGHARIWASTFDGLWYQDNGRWQKYGSAIAAVEDLHVTGSGDGEQLWISTIGQGLWRIDRDGMRHWSVESGELPSNDLYAMDTSRLADGDSVLWVASRAGVLRVHRDRVRVFDRRYGLPSDAVRGLSVWRSPDGIDVLWLATENGVARAVLGASRWRTASLLGSRGTGVFGLLPEPDGHGGERLWVAANADGLGLYDNGVWRQFSRANGLLPGNDATLVQRAPDDTGRSALWLGLGGGYLFRVDEGPRFVAITTPWQARPGEGVSDILGRVEDGHVERWFATRQSGIYRWREGKWTAYLARGATAPWRVSHLLAQTDANGRDWLWAASMQGLARFDGNQWDATVIALPDTFLFGLNLMRDANGRAVLWIGSNNHGIVRVDVTDPAHPALLPADLPPSPDPTAYGAVADSQGRIYICTNAGVQQLTPDNGGYRSRVFTRRDGLVNDECNGHAQAIDARDRFWTGTLGGAAVFDPTAGIRDTTPKPLRWMGAWIDNLPADGERIVIPPGRHELVARFALLAWNRESESRFRTQLAGYEATPGAWTEQNARVFDNLPPGRYSLRIEARDYAGNLSPPLQIAVEVLPEWWQRWWAWAVLGMMLVAMAAGITQWRTRSLTAQRRRLERQVGERTAELHAANQRLLELSYSDALTGLANRRRLLEALDRSARTPGGSRVAMIFVDVDHFKAYNDRFGHPAGDVALRCVADALRTCAPTDAIVARYGGEEFACIIGDVPIERAREIGERIRRDVARRDVMVPGTATVNRITISAGVACATLAAEADIHALLRTADIALYQAKREGRDRVCG
ncbi:MAG: diguanylate cyclase [Proteobacteria bacterium]|nr:diguanylate cyclase [Pseudomonadota bacterium]